MEKIRRMKQRSHQFLAKGSRSKGEDTYLTRGGASAPWTGFASGRGPPWIRLDFYAAAGLFPVKV